MKTAALLRCGGAALRSSGAPSPSHQVGISHYSYTTAAQPERKVAILGAAIGPPHETQPSGLLSLAL